MENSNVSWKLNVTVWNIIFLNINLLQCYFRSSKIYWDSYRYPNIIWLKRSTWLEIICMSHKWWADHCWARYWWAWSIAAISNKKYYKNFLYVYFFSFFFFSLKRSYFDRIHYQIFVVWLFTEAYPHEKRSCLQIKWFGLGKIGNQLRQILIILIDW